MPIKIPAHLPGRAVLEREKIAIIDEARALRQDIRPLQIAIFNLMPDKIATETQLLRALGATPLQLEITLLHMASHASRNTPEAHLTAFYQTLGDVRHRKFDALILTGAPVEHLPFAEVGYWPELQEVFDWAAAHVYSSFFICWGAQAALHHYHGLPKHSLPAKRMGVFLHKVLKPFETVTAGFDDHFGVPVARNTETRSEDVARVPALEVLVESEETGLCLVQDQAARRFYMFNHLEYDADTIAAEFVRDQVAGLNPVVPPGYFPDNDPAAMPRVTWRAHRNLLFGNWVNSVYQGTPYELAEIGT